MIIRSVGELAMRHSLHSTTCEATITEVCRRLQEHHVGALAVLDDGKLVGIISERDVISRVIAVGREPTATTVRAVMTPDPQTIDCENYLIDALQKMLDGHFRHLPVMRGDEVIGMISMRDIPTEDRLMYQRFTEAHEASVAAQMAECALSQAADRQ